MSAPTSQHRHCDCGSSSGQRQRQPGAASILRTLLSKVSGTLSNLFIGLIKLYQWLVSPVLGGRCRFYPTCSEYAKQALKEHGIVRGSLLMIKRLARCHPFCEGGVDLVPNKKVK